MTGVEHYQAAERILEDAELRSPHETPDRAVRVAEAQTHATLALAAATSSTGMKSDPGGESKPPQYLGQA